MNESLLLALKVYGLAIVISMLVAIMIRVIVASLSAARRQPQAVAPNPEVSVNVAADHIAAIAAALYAVIGAHRIVHIGDRGRGYAWTSEGRAAHHASHSIAKRARP